MGILAECLNLGIYWPKVMLQLKMYSFVGNIKLIWRSISCHTSKMV